MMHTFCVWAPFPRKVEVQVGGELVSDDGPMHGWWTAEIPFRQRRAMTTVSFLMAKGRFPIRVRRRSRAAIHKLSRLVDQISFSGRIDNWQAPPLSSAVIYELHIGTFTPAGTFLSAIEKLDHLVALGRHARRIDAGRRNFPAIAAGVTTAWIYSRRIMPMAGRTI